jgi:RecB family endonuclease NucS
MPRSVVIRSRGEAVERLVEESVVPTEAALHEVLMRHPSLVPASDLGFERMVTVGFEASLASGSADLVLLDRRGRICLVEVKKEGNPDTRRVIAQLLDYAAALWGLTLDEFELQVLRRMLRAPERTLREFVAEELVAGSEDAEEEVERLLDGLSERCGAGTSRWC